MFLYSAEYFDVVGKVQHGDRAVADLDHLAGRAVLHMGLVRVHERVVVRAPVWSG